MKAQWREINFPLCHFPPWGSSRISTMVGGTTESEFLQKSFDVKFVTVLQFSGGVESKGNEKS